MPRGNLVHLGMAIATWLSAATGGAKTALSQQEAFETRVERAVAILDSAQTERGIDSLRALLSAEPRSGLRRAVARAHLYLASASWALGLRDSAEAHFREAVKANPFAVPDPEVFHPDIVAEFRRVKRTTPALDLRTPADTVLDPRWDKYLLGIAVGQPLEVTISVVGTGGNQTLFSTQTERIDSSATIPLAPLTADSSPLTPGTYRLLAEGRPQLEASVVLLVARLAVDTASHLSPLDSAQFRPETRPGPPAAMSALAGFIFGAAAAAVPIALTHPAISQAADPGAIAVGGSIAIAGIAGVFLGRRPVPIPENIAYNRNLVASWEQRNREIAAENSRRRSWAPLRIQVVP